MSEEQKGGPFKMGDLRSLIEEVVSGMGKGKEDDPKPKAKEDEAKNDDKGTGTVREAVAREIAKIRDKEDRDARDTRIDAELLKLGEASKEKQPIERRRVHRFMGWGEND